MFPQGIDIFSMMDALPATIYRSNDMGIYQKRLMIAIVALVRMGVTKSGACTKDFPPLLFVVLTHNQRTSKTNRPETLGQNGSGKQHKTESGFVGFGAESWSRASSIGFRSRALNLPVFVPGGIHGGHVRARSEQKHGTCPSNGGP